LTERFLHPTITCVCVIVDIGRQCVSIEDVSGLGLPLANSRAQNVSYYSSVISWPQVCMQGVDGAMRRRSRICHKLAKYGRTALLPPPPHTTMNILELAAAVDEYQLAMHQNKGMGPGAIRDGTTRFLHSGLIVFNRKTRSCEIVRNRV
jgi:hypothetical protein